MKKNKKIYILMIIGVVILCGMFLYVNSKSLPSHLRASKHTDEEVLRNVIEEGDVLAVLFNPIFEDQAINDRVQVLIDEITEDIKENVVQANEIKVDYDYTLLEDGVFSFLFTMEKTKYLQEGSEVSYDYYSFLWDVDLKEDLQDYYAADVLERLTKEVRYEIQSNTLLSDEVFTLAFYESTMDIVSGIEAFYIDNENVYVYINEGAFAAHEDIEIVYSLEEVSLVDQQLQQVGENLITIPMRFIDPNKPMIALTYDDGPRAGVTDEIVYYLNDYGQNATFFMLGSRIANKDELIIDMINGGNDAATHSMTHENLNKLTDEELSYQLEEPANMIYSLSEGEYVVTLHRPPYGASNDEVKSKSKYPFILWNIDSLDWKHHSVDESVNIILESASDGDIILLHDLYFQAVDITKIIVPELIERGFQIVSASQLAQAKGVTLEPGKAYRSIKG